MIMKDLDKVLNLGGPHVNEMYSRADFLLAACQTTFKVVCDSWAGFYLDK